jgi:hypothetical protein
VAAAAKGSQPLQSTGPEETADDETDQVELIEHSFALHPDHVTTLELPADLTKTEVGRLDAFIQALPFGDEC